MGHLLYTLHMQELRVKGSYLHHKEITAAQGVKIAAPGLENAVAGTQLLVVGKGDDVSLLKEEVMQDMESIFDSVDRSGRLGCPLLCCARLLLPKELEWASMPHRLHFANSPADAHLVYASHLHICQS